MFNEFYNISKNVKQKLLDSSELVSNTLSNFYLRILIEKVNLPKAKMHIYSIYQKEPNGLKANKKIT